MGIQLRTISVKWDQDTVRMSDELQTHFAPLVEGRSQLTRLAIKKLYADVSTYGVLAVVGECLQVLPGNTSSHQEFEVLLARTALQQAKIPSKLFPRFGLKTGVN